jgi:hypothetical protein
MWNTKEHNNEEGEEMQREIFKDLNNPMTP